MTALTEIETEVENMATEDAHHTNVYVGIEFEGKFTARCFGPFRTAEEASSWCETHIIDEFEIHEIMRPVGVEDIAFSLVERTLEDQGIHPSQAEIGDYIDPNVGT